MTTDEMVSYEQEFMRYSTLENWRNAFQGGDILCLGAGASLREQEPERLKCGIPILACNSSWRWLGFDPMGIVITDSRRLKEEAVFIQERSFPPNVFCSPSSYQLERVSSSWAQAAKSIRGNLVPMRGGGASSNLFDPTNGLNSQGGSVIFHAITLAAFMGARRIFLLGCDFDYSKSPAWWNDTTQLPKWLGLGDFAERALQAMRMYAREYEKRGIQLINATKGGRIDFLPRVNYEETFK